MDLYEKAILDAVAAVINSLPPEVFTCMDEDDIRDLCCDLNDFFSGLFDRALFVGSPASHDPTGCDLQ